MFLSFINVARAPRPRSSTPPRPGVETEPLPQEVVHVAHGRVVVQGVRRVFRTRHPEPVTTRVPVEAVRGTSCLSPSVGRH